MVWFNIIKLKGKEREDVGFEVKKKKKLRVYFFILKIRDSTWDNFWEKRGILLN